VKLTILEQLGVVLPEPVGRHAAMSRGSAERHIQQIREIKDDPNFPKK